MSSRLSARAAQFISNTFPSVASLDALLLLREIPERSWTADDMAVKLRLTPAALPDQLNGLVARGLVELASGTVAAYRYRPRTDELQALIDEVAQAYRVESHSVIACIHG